MKDHNKNVGKFKIQICDLSLDNKINSDSQEYNSIEEDEIKLNKF